ncbi:helix-turn-helix transcriptional regulator [Chitinimonas lacunae]|uniref:Helix-turn-helix transcriptional regulator n=1 Tax=Chitinimonas lacunae TaxID=1963018 RepID=A0ABV8MTJ5_9NEIS
MQQYNPHHHPVVLRLPQVKERVGLSRATIYLRMQDGTFPGQINLGGRAVGWLESDIDEWLEAQIQQSRAAQAHKKNSK